MQAETDRPEDRDRHEGSETDRQAETDRPEDRQTDMKVVRQTCKQRQT